MEKELTDKQKKQINSLTSEKLFMFVGIYIAAAELIEIINEMKNKRPKIKTNKNVLWIYD